MVYTAATARADKRYKMKNKTTLAPKYREYSKNFYNKNIDKVRERNRNYYHFKQFLKINLDDAPQAPPPAALPVVICH